MRSLGNRRGASVAGMGGLVGVAARASLLLLCSCAGHGIGICQTNRALCRDGAGQFTSKALSGVIVSVGAQRDSSFATRACEARFIWRRKEVPVVRNAHQIDIDLMGADLGLGVPVAALQVKKSAFDSSMSYEVFSLEGTPRMMRTITGGDYYRAADTAMDGRVEIWTHDAGAAAGFEGVPIGDFDFPPTVVLRFEGGRLMDVSSEFQTDYDLQIAQVRGQLDAKQLSEFKNCDGKLDVIPPEQLKNLHDLLTAKIQVLEIVWAYLYSGREQQAWQALGEMWPTADFLRIRTSIADAQAHGIRSEIDGVTSPDLTLRKKKKQVQVYELALQTQTTNSEAPRFANSPQEDRPPGGSSLRLGVDWPEPIFLDVPLPPDGQQNFPSSGVLLDLVIDDAGKVHSAALVNKIDQGPASDSDLAASVNWKFIPAMKNGQAVASHIHMTVSPFK